MHGWSFLFDQESAPAALKLAMIVILVSFLPINAFTYQRFRSRRKRARTERILTLLKIRREDRERYLEIKPGKLLCMAVVYATVVSIVGLTVLAFGEQMKFPENALLTRESWLVFGMGFLGGYLWGIQYVLRRYSVDDLNPGVYHGLAIRMVLAGVLAAVIYNAYEALAGGDSGPISGNVWPALALVLGMFPQRGITWIRDRVPFLSDNDPPGVRKAPLEMIEGITFHDRVRLEEEGIDNCYDLATSDFVPLVIHTPYSARALTDWILQAKLCSYTPEAMGNLRQQGIRTILDLASLDGDGLKALAEATTVTRSALERAQASVKVDREIERLRHVGSALSRFTGLEDPLHLVVGGKLKEPGSLEFADYTKLTFVGIYPDHRAAHAAWKTAGQAAANDTDHRYFIGHVHRLDDPATAEQEKAEGPGAAGGARPGTEANGHAGRAGAKVSKVGRRPAEVEAPAA